MTKLIVSGMKVPEPMPASAIKKLDDAIEAEVEAAVDFARTSPDPLPEEALTDLWREADDPLPAQAGVA